MPFLRRRDDGRWYPCATVDLRQLPVVGHRRARFEVLHDFGYTSLTADGGSPAHPTWSRRRVEHVVPRGMVTDLASVPAVLWGVIASYGQHTLPAVLHDKLYRDLRLARAAGLPVGVARPRRRAADRLFRSTLRLTGAGPVRQWLMWSAPRVFGRSLLAVPFVALASVLLLIGAISLLGWLIAPGIAAAVVVVAAAAMAVVILRAAVERPAGRPGRGRLRAVAVASLVGAVAIALLAVPPMVVVIVVTGTVRWVVGLGERSAPDLPVGGAGRDVAATARITWSPLVVRSESQRRWGRGRRGGQ